MIFARGCVWAFVLFLRTMTIVPGKIPKAVLMPSAGNEIVDRVIYALT